MISFNVPAITNNEQKYISQVLENKKVSGDGLFTKRCNEWFEVNFNARKALLTTSCTHALEMAAILADIQEGDEVIMPSYTFVSTANAFVLRGAEIVFIDVEPNTMNMDAELVEAAITPRTKAIVPVHYAGISCDMDILLDLSKKYDLTIIEDAAQGVMSKYKNKHLGTIGHIGCYSFHETKNYHCGEGGAILLNDPKYVERAEIIREKGTNRSRFFRGQVDKYTWVDIGSSYLPSEINAAFLYAQLEAATDINNNRLTSWGYYYQKLLPLQIKGKLGLPIIPEFSIHNAHMFYIKLKNIVERTKLLDFLKDHGIMSVFHYVPLHSSEAGIKFGRFHGVDKYTTEESDKLLRLPLYYNMSLDDINYVIDQIYSYFLLEGDI
jgi:dTDP-4-amino-4,6-dideoxygalactose transaminase